MKKSCLVVILALIGRCTLAIREVDEIAQAKAAKGDLTGEIVTFVFGPAGRVCNLNDNR
jgi:hypothetical protein